jgi:hypothetical protein
MRSLLLVSLLVLLLLPILHGAAQPDNMTRELDPELMELKKKINEKINMTELEKFWEEMKNVPGPSLTPEPNVYVPGRGYVTDGRGRSISPLGTNERDRYYDVYGNSFYVYVGDTLVFGNVADSQFKGTYFSVWNSTGYCLNYASGIQTFSDYKHYNWIGNYTMQTYPNFFKIHVKYFVQAKLKDYVYKNGNMNNKVYLVVRYGSGYITQFEAELWSEENYCKGVNTAPTMKCYHVGWGNNRCGYPDDTDGGASRIRGKTISVSVGLSYYRPYPTLSSRSFGHPYIITLYSRFYHQFALLGVKG